MTSPLGPFRNARRIVCRLPTWVGDVVMATPALRALRRGFPDAEIILQGRPKVMELLAGCDLHDGEIPAEGGRGRVGKNVAHLRGANADLAIILPHSFRSAWECFRARIPLRVGYAREGRRLLLTHSVTPHRRSERLFDRRILPIPMTVQYLELAALVGAPGDDAGPHLAIDDELRAAGEATLAGYGIEAGRLVVALNPGASFGPSKIWPLRSYAAVGDAFARELDAQVLILCGPGEEPLAREIEEHMESPVISTADAPPPLAELKPILERVDLMVTSDAGPRHIATAVDTSTVVLMGPTDPRYSSSHMDRCVVLRKDVPCGPCHLKVCPIDHRCMTGISVEEVVATGTKLLGLDREPAST